MVACDEIRDLLGPWLDRETTPKLSARVAAHLAECAACRADAEEIRELDAMLDLDVDPADLEARVLAAIAERWSLGWWLRTVAAAAIAIGLGLAAGGAFNTQKNVGVQNDDAPLVMTMIDDHFGNQALDGFGELAEDLQTGANR